MLLRRKDRGCHPDGAVNGIMYIQLKVPPLPSSQQPAQTFLGLRKGHLERGEQQTIGFHKLKKEKFKCLTHTVWAEGNIFLKKTKLHTSKYLSISHVWNDMKQTKNS